LQPEKNLQQFLLFAGLHEGNTGIPAWLSFADVLQVAVVEVPNTGDGSLRVRLQASFRVPEKKERQLQ
jgi:hypothetical protein